MLPLIVVGVMYFLVIRPQSKKAKPQALLISQLKRGDEVVTNGGLIGRISGIKDDEITLQVQEGVRFRVLRTAVTGLYRPTPEAAKTDVKTDAKTDAKASASL